MPVLWRFWLLVRLEGIFPGSLPVPYQQRPNRPLGPGDRLRRLSSSLVELLKLPVLVLVCQGPASFVAALDFGTSLLRLPVRSIAAASSCATLATDFAVTM